MSQICPKGAANTRNAQGARARFTMSQICPNGAANARNGQGARAHFTMSLISNCRWGIGAIAVLPGVSLWINQRLNPITLGLQPPRKAGNRFLSQIQCHRFNVTDLPQQCSKHQICARCQDSYKVLKYAHTQWNFDFVKYIGPPAASSGHTAGVKPGRDHPRSAKPESS